MSGTWTRAKAPTRSRLSAKKSAFSTSAYCSKPANTSWVRPKVPPTRSFLCRLCQNAYATGSRVNSTKGTRKGTRKR